MNKGTSFSVPYATATAAHVLVEIEEKCYQKAKADLKKDEDESRQIGTNYDTITCFYQATSK